MSAISQLYCSLQRRRGTGWRALTLCLVVTLAAGAPPLLAAADSADDQARLYRQTLIAIRKGHRTNTERGMRELADYPLYPYLEKARLSKRLRQRPEGAVEAFLKRYHGTVAGRQLHKQWLRELADQEAWKRFLQDYDPQVASDSLRCYYLQALHARGFQQAAVERTPELWLSGRSMPDSCDPVFERWEAAGGKTDALVWQRVGLALDNGDTVLARYLSNHASPALQPYTRRLLSVHYRPYRLEKPGDFAEQNSYTTDIISHGLMRLASRDAERASTLWDQYRGSHRLSPASNHAIRDKIARQFIADGHDNALQWLILHDPNAEDSYLLEWRIRLALKERRWDRASHWIGLLPAELRQDPRWRYWLARAWREQRPDQARALLEELATERNYYGFLAAEWLGRDYDLNHHQLDAVALEQLHDHDALRRAKAFFDMGELTAARREWYAAISQFDQRQLIDATHLAHRWGWHQQAIHTTIKAGQWDDMSIRFPLAYHRDMSQSAHSASIRLDWLYAITRQESAFAEDARSSADARGLMQLLPHTARQVARSLGVPFSSRDLYRADTNITLGSNYLRQLLDTFDGNHVLATAAYNAGPHRVHQWLKSQPGELPYDIWIETLPYYETRNYVQSVLAFSVIYSRRLGLEDGLITPQQAVIRNNE